MVLALMEARVASGAPTPGSPRRPAGALQWERGPWEWGGGPTPVLLAFSSQWRLLQAGSATALADAVHPPVSYDLLGVAH